MPILDRNFDYVVLDMIESAAKASQTKPLNLGGISGSGGGIGGPPGGFIGRLNQTRVSYDIDELASSGIPISGSSLLDNLNHIRYRLDAVEASGVSGTITVVDDDTPATYTVTDTVHFSGAGVTVVDLGAGDVRVEITATGSGGGGAVDSVNGYTGTVVLSASDIDIVDASGYYTSTNVEDALEEIYEYAATISGGGGGFLLGRNWLPFGGASDTSPLSVTGAIPYAATVDRNFTLKSWANGVLVAGTNDGSNYWTIELWLTSNTGGSAVSLASFDTSAFSPNGWERLSTTTFSTSAITTTAANVLYIRGLKTGSPGNLYISGPSVEVDV